MLIYYSPIDGHLGCLQLWVIVNTDATNTGGQISVKRPYFQLFWVYTQEWNWWSIWKFLFNFLEPTILHFIEAASFYIPISNVQGFQLGETGTLMYCQAYLYAYWPFGYPLIWRGISSILCIFFNGLWIFPLLICISHLQILILSPLQTSHTVASTHYVIFLKNFCFEIIVDLEKQFVKTVQEFPYTLHPHSSNVNW